MEETEKEKFDLLGDVDCRQIFAFDFMPIRDIHALQQCANVSLCVAYIYRMREAEDEW